MIRAVLATIVVLLATPFLVICQTKDKESKAVQEVRKVDEEFHSAFRMEDAPALERLLAANFIWTHSTGNIQTKEQILTNIRCGKTAYEALDIDDVSVCVYSNAAVVSGHSTRNYPGKDRFQIRYSVFYVKDRGRWSAAAFHTSILPEK